MSEAESSLQKRDLEIIDSFIRPERRERYRALLHSGKRSKIITMISSSHDVDMEIAKSIDPKDEFPTRLERLLYRLGALPTCYVMSQITEIDGREMPLIEALNGASGSDCGTIISCKAGQLGYYEGEMGERYILLRAPK